MATNSHEKMVAAFKTIQAKKLERAASMMHATAGKVKVSTFAGRLTLSLKAENAEWSISFNPELNEDEIHKVARLLSNQVARVSYTSFK